MSPSPIPISLRRGAVPVAVIAAALAAHAPASTAATPRAAAAATAQGTVTFTASGAAGRELRRSRVRLSAPRRTSLVDGSTRLTFTVSSRAVRGGEGAVRLRGTLRFTRGKRTVRFTSLRLTARSSRVRLTGRGPDGRRRTLLTGRPRSRAVALQADRRVIDVRATTTSMPKAAGRLVRSRLRLRRVPRGTFGPIAVQAGRPSTGTTGSGTTGSTPGVQPPTADVAPAARPATAGAIVAGTLVWRVRESFIRYVSTGEGASAQDGATADPPETLPEAGVPLVYQFRFPFRAGWSDPATGSASIGFSGAVRFRYSDHTIDFTTAEPEIELGPAGSRATFRLTGAGGTPFTGTRVVLLDLNPAAVASRTVSPDGRTVTYERIPATVPAGTGDSVFAGFYLAGTPFGWLTLSYTTA